MVALATPQLGSLEGHHLLPRITSSTERRSSFERALERADPFSAVRSPSQPPLLQPPRQTTPEGRERNLSFDDPGRERHTSADPGRRGPTCVSRPQSRLTPRPGCRRKVLCTWGGALGQRSLITVQTGFEPIKAPYTVIVSYDLRPALGSLTGKENIYLAALDAEKLRRRGAGTGVDAMQASETWLAKDCLCSASGKLKLLTDVKGRGEVKMMLAPTQPKGETEACVLLRVVALKNQQDPHDWCVLGSAVVLKIDMGRKSPQQGCQQLARQLLDGDAVEVKETRSESSLTEDGREGQDGLPSGPSGVPLQQLLDFQEEIQADLERYCSVHRLCVHEGRHQSYHVCMAEPCPYRPINKQRFCDHRGLLFVPRSALDDEEVDDLEDLAPDVQLVVRRYVWPYGSGAGRSRFLLLSPERQPKIGTYVAHSWAEPFAEFLQTLQRALDGDAYVFVPGLMLGDGAVIHGRSGGAGELEQRPFATSLRKAERLLLVADRSSGFARCLWCGFEVAKAKDWHVPTLVWPHHAADIGKLKDAVARLDLQKASAEPEELRSLLLVGAKGSQPDMEAANRQLRSFLQCRINCFVSALQDAKDFRDSNPERLRHLCAEHEHRAARRESGREHSRRVEDFEAEAQEQSRALERSRAAASSAREAHAAEARRFEEQLAEAARQAALQEDRQKEVEAKAQRLGADLEEAGRELARLRAELAEEHLKAKQEAQTLEQVRREAAAHAKRAEELQAEAEKEREKYIEEKTRWEEASEIQANLLEDTRRQAEEKAKEDAVTIRELTEHWEQAAAALEPYRAAEEEEIDRRSNGTVSSHTDSRLRSSGLKSPLRRSGHSVSGDSVHSANPVTHKASELSVDVRQTITAGVNFFMGGKSKDKKADDAKKASGATLAATLSTSLGSWGFSSKPRTSSDDARDPVLLEVSNEEDAGTSNNEDMASENSETRSAQASVGPRNSPVPRKSSIGVGLLKIPVGRSAGSKNSKE